MMSRANGSSACSARGAHVEDCESCGLLCRWQTEGRVEDQGSAGLQVTIVGKIVSVHDTSTSIDFQVNDGTGVVEVKHWRDAEDEVRLHFNLSLSTGRPGRAALFRVEHLEACFSHNSSF